MNILAFSPFPLDAMSGNIVTLRRIRTGVEKRGHSFTIAPISPADTEEDARQAADKASPDVVHFYHAYKTGRFLPALDRYPSVVTLSGTDLNRDYENADRRSAIDRALAGAHRIVTYNRSLLAKDPVRSVSAKATLIPKGVLLGELEFDLRAAAGLTRNHFVVLQSGGIRPVKNNRFALQALRGIRPEPPNLRLVFLGPILDPDYGRELQADLAQFPGAVYLPPVDFGRMASAYRDADLVLNTSRMEGLSNALMEALAAGAVVLAADIPGNRDLFSEALSWLLYRDEKDLQDKVATLIASSDRRAELGAAARAHADKTFSTDREVDALLEAYEVAINSHRAS